VTIDPAQPCVLDPQFFPQKGNLLLEPLVLCLQANPGVDAVGGPTPRVNNGELGQ